MLCKIMLKAFDINFGVNLRVQEVGGAIEHELDPPTKITAGEFFVMERKAIDFEDRHIVMILDNSGSKLRSKTLLYRVTITAPETNSIFKDEYRKVSEDYVISASQVNLEATSTNSMENRGSSGSTGFSSGDPPSGQRNRGNSNSISVGDGVGIGVNVDGSVGGSTPSTPSVVGNLYSVLSTAVQKAQGAVREAAAEPRVTETLQYIQVS